MLTYILFAVGFILLIKGADILVEGASAIAQRFNIPSIVIGLTIVSFGTSAPELVVNIFASLEGKGDLNLGNVLGSNIANILLILGVSGTIHALKIKKGTVWKEIPFALLAVVVLGIVANDALIDEQSFNTISRIDGLMFFSFFIIFMYYTFGISQTNGGHGEPIHKLSMPKATTMFVIGLVGLTFGGNFIVDGAITIARSFGVTEALIGLTIVAFGTSLPELATSIVAARKGNIDIAVGNVVGSNIFNIFLVLGTTALINPITFNPVLNIDILIAIGVTLMLFLSAFVGKRHSVDKWQCGLYLFLYALYMAYLFARG